jgi:hypothetical protein
MFQMSHPASAGGSSSNRLLSPVVYSVQRGRTYIF